LHSTYNKAKRKGEEKINREEKGEKITRKELVCHQSEEQI
jgi:hypothetical protein